MIANLIALTGDEYLQWEEQQNKKHEYVNSQILAIPVASENHVIITDNLSAIPIPALRETPCRSFSSAMKLKIATENIYYYPDLFITCHNGDRQTIQN